MLLNASALHAACPSRKYHRCFYNQLQAKYPVTQFRLPQPPRRCTRNKRAAALLDDAGCALPAAQNVLNYVSGPRLRLCGADDNNHHDNSNNATVAADHHHDHHPLNCSSPAAAINAQAVLLLGVPSSPTPTGRMRRDAIRASWMRDTLIGRSVIVCFLLSAQTPSEQLRPMADEHAKHGDMLFLDSPETPQLIKTATRYSGGLKKGRGMPTFKQYAFFQYAAAVLHDVPFVGKVDDDTAPNVRVLVPFLRRLACVESRPLALVGAINFASFVPRAANFGVRGDRCGFGWDLRAALTNFGSSFGRKGTAGYIEACDLRGGVLPFPYATGAGYLFSSALLRHIAQSAEVTGWVADAAGPTREELQWQKYEDTSTGYFVSSAPRTVRYVDIGPLVHDINCHEEGERKRRGGGTYRPPTNVSLMVHNLKSPSAFAFAWEHMQPTTRPYEHAACVKQVWRRNLAPVAARTPRRPKGRRGRARERG